jgi:hypothetical protein
MKKPSSELLTRLAYVVTSEYDSDCVSCAAKVIASKQAV